MANLYSYNESGIDYDEPCFFYNGGFDLKCLYGKPKIVGRGGSKTTTRKSYPQPEMVSLFFKSCLRYVNSKEFDEKFETKKYSFKRNPSIDVIVKNLELKKSKYILTSKTSSPKIVDKNIKIENVFTEQLKTVISSSNFELKTKSYISSSLKLNRPRKIKFSSSIIKRNNGK